MSISISGLRLLLEFMMQAIPLEESKLLEGINLGWNFFLQKW